MRWTILVAAALASGCGALATERREEPDEHVPVILPPPPGAVPEAPAPATTAPSAVPGARGALPVSVGQTWVGQYACPPGPADVTVRIEAVRGTDVEAVFQIATGRYALTGHYDAPSGALELVPTRWLEQSPSAPLVGLYGTISPDATVYEGRVTDPTCRWFTLRSRASD